MKLRHAAALGAAFFSALVPISAGLGVSVAAAAAPTTVYVNNLQPSWAAPGGGGVYSAYYGPPAYSAVSPGSSSVFDGREAGIIKAGVTPWSPGEFDDEGLFAFRPGDSWPGVLAIEDLATGPLTYDVENQSGANPVWMTIEVDTGIPGDRADNMVYQYVPATNPSAWHTVDAGAATTWRAWDDCCSGNPTGPDMSLGDIASAHPGKEVVRVYLRLGMGNSYGVPVSTIGWVDKVSIGDVTFDFRTLCTTTCYVDTATGDDTGSGHSDDPFKTIDKGIDSVTPGGTVQVAAGTYDENVRIDKQLTLQGAGQGVTTIVPATSNPNPCAGSSLCGTATAASNVILVESDDVTIADLTVDGDNTSLTSGVVVGGADLDARNGIIGNYYAGTFNNLEVHDVTVQNIYLRGVYASASGTFDIHDNTVTNVQADPASIAMMNWKGSGSFTGNTVSSSNDGIVSNHSSGTTYTGNVVTGSPSGIHTDNAGDEGGTPDVIQGNTVSGCPSGGYGIWVFVPYIAPTVDENTVSGCDIGLGAFGGAFSPAPTVTGVFTQNTVSNTGAPAGSIGLWIDTTTFNWGDTDVDVSASNNFISGFETGVQVIESGGATATASLNDNSITGNTTGVPAITTAATLDAEGNWWGATSGPTNPANPPGTGQSVGSGVDFTPWLCSGTDTSGAPGFQPTGAPCAGTVSFGADQVTVEGGALTTHTVSIPVTLSPAYPGGTVTATWKTTDATAKAANNDYVAVASGTVTFVPGDTSETITVTVKGDTKLEQYETFTVDLVSATNATIGGDVQAAITIKNDELPTVKVTGTSVNEGSPVKFTLKLNQQYYAPLTLSFSTLNTGTATSLAGDFAAVSGLSVPIAADLTTGLVWLPTLIDGVPEATVETVKAQVTGGKAPVTGTGRIKANVT